MPQHDGIEVLTIRKADEAKFVAEAWFKDKGYADMPAMYKPGHEGSMWVLSLEGYDDWAVELSQDESVRWPVGVWVEPVASWCLGLYPA